MMDISVETSLRPALFEYLLRLGDDLLILGQRLGEWCGHGPVLEEDIALTNISLDCFGQAEALLRTAGLVEGEGRSEDDLAYFRDETEFRNLQLVERPNGHFGDTIARQFLFDAFALEHYRLLVESSFQPLADIAAKIVKEKDYHLRHSRQWLIRLGDGTQESHSRMQASIENLWEFTGELFFMDENDQILLAAQMVPDLKKLKPIWLETVKSTLAEATLAQPQDPAHFATGSRLGSHSEHLGHLLAEMQILARSHPGASW